MLARKISIFDYSNEIAQIVRKAEVRFTNCECLFHNGESYPMPRGASIATLWYAEPSLVKELEWLGFNLASLANTHATDYGPSGLLSTIHNLEASGIVCAGAGRDLDEARESKFLETPNGRVALIAACWDTWHTAWERASNGRSGIPPRPGMNLLRVKSDFTVSKEKLDTIREIIHDIGADAPSGKKKDSKENGLDFLDHKFRAGVEIGTFRKVVEKDLDDLKQTIEDARKFADWVLVSFHSHNSSPIGLEYPSELIRSIAHACIDSGADAFLGHGPHILRGIEVYKRRPIFYSLGNFIAHNNFVKKVTADQYEFYDLGDGAKPWDFYHAREGIIPPAEAPYSNWWYESVIASFELGEEGIADLKLYPITLGEGDVPETERGNPRLADQKVGQKIIDSLNKMSREFGAQISLDANGVGKLKD